MCIRIPITYSTYKVSLSVRKGTNTVTIGLLLRAVLLRKLYSTFALSAPCEFSRDFVRTGNYHGRQLISPNSHAPQAEERYRTLVCADSRANRAVPCIEFFIVPANMELVILHKIQGALCLVVESKTIPSKLPKSSIGPAPWDVSPYSIRLDRSTTTPHYLTLVFPE
jgi:hypothetical protein